MSNYDETPSYNKEKEEERALASRIHDEAKVTMTQALGSLGVKPGMPKSRHTSRFDRGRGRVDSVEITGTISKDEPTATVSAEVSSRSILDFLTGGRLSKHAMHRTYNLAMDGVTGSTYIEQISEANLGRYSERQHTVITTDPETVNAISSGHNNFQGADERYYTEPLTGDGAELATYATLNDVDAIATEAIKFIDSLL
jgi:hypothetical protein